MMKRGKREKQEMHKPGEETVYVNLVGPWIMVREEFMKQLVHVMFVGIGVGQMIAYVVAVGSMEMIDPSKVRFGALDSIAIS